LHKTTDNDYDNWVGSSSILKPKELTATYEYPLSSSTGGIRLEAKILDDQVNPSQTITYSYGAGHYTALPGDWLANYFNGFSAFISHENDRHKRENAFYEYLMYNQYPSWISDYYEYMAHRLKNFRIDRSAG